jgi:D-inositol-3-phosphate glycosyltransferase
MRNLGGEVDRSMKEHAQIREENFDPASARESVQSAEFDKEHKVSIALLTGGGDKPYAYGMATELIAKGVTLNLIGSDDLDLDEFRDNPQVNFLNLRGGQRPGANFLEKAARILKYYVRLIRYAATAKPKIFHILWHNKFLAFDRTLVMLYYKLIGKRLVFTAHNVNSGKRDSNDSVLNRLTLRCQYGLADHVFVHTPKMKHELMADFRVPEQRITVIPFGINNAVPVTNISSLEAKQRLGIPNDKKCILFFGNITPYKGLEYLVAAFQQVRVHRTDCQLIIAGRPLDCEGYWNPLRAKIGEELRKGDIIVRANYIPDEETELYFKAADVLVLPYTHVYQSGVLFLGYSFGLPVLAADVGSMKDEIIEGRTGSIFKPRNSQDLARAIEQYFASDLYKKLGTRRQEIRHFAMERHSWDVVGQRTLSVYTELLGLPKSWPGQNSENPKPSLKLNGS